MKQLISVFFLLLPALALCQSFQPQDFTTNNVAVARPAFQNAINAVTNGQANVSFGTVNANGGGTLSLNGSTVSVAGALNAAAGNFNNLAGNANAGGVTNVVTAPPAGQTNAVGEGPDGKLVVLTTGGGGGGNTYNYIITNQFSGTVAGFAGTESNMTIVTGGASFPVNGGPTYTESLFTGNVQSNSVYAPAGMILGPTTATFWYSANGGNVFTPTNVYQMVFTNGAEDTALRNTFTTGGIQTNLNTSALVAPSTICVVWSNSPSTFGMAGCTAQWFIGCQVPSTIASVSTTVTNVGQLIAPNVEFVSPYGSDSTGARGTANAFAHLYTAVGVAQSGDVTYVLPGIYTGDGTNNICGQVPKNYTITPLGTAYISYAITASGSLLTTSNDYYLQPNDNLRINPGIVFSTTTSNKSSAFFGTYSAEGSCTNVLVSLNSTYADSDGLLFWGSNLTKIVFINCDISGADDVFTTGNNINLYQTNSIFDLIDCRLRPNVPNGILYPNRHGLNINGVANYLLNDVQVFDNKSDGESTYGLEADGAPLLNIIFNGVTFYDSAPTNNNADIVLPTLIGAGSSWVGVQSGTTNALAIYNGGLPGGTGQLGLSGNFSGDQQKVGALTIPLNISSDPLDSEPAGVYGQWFFTDIGTNGIMLLTNRFNQTAVNGGSAVLFQPDDLGASAPEPGKFVLRDMYYVGNGQGLTNIQTAPYPMTNYIDGVGTVWYSNQVTHVAKGVTTNSSVISTIGTLPGTNDYVDFSQTHWFYTANANVWFIQASNIPSGPYWANTTIDIYNQSNTAITVYSGVNFFIRTNTISTNALTIPPGAPGRLYFDYNGLASPAQTNEQNVP